MTRTTSPVISSLRLSQRPSHQPDHREEQIQWAREVLASDGKAPSDIIAACNALLALSRDAAEIAAAGRIKDEAIRQSERFQQIWAGGMMEDQRESIADDLRKMVWLVTILFGIAGAGVVALLIRSVFP